MFGFFKKKKLKIDESLLSFFKQLFERIPSKYQYLSGQVNKEFILDVKPSRMGYEGCYDLSLNANLESKFSNRSLPRFFIIKDISVWNKKSMEYDLIDLDVVDGMFAGFCVKVDFNDLDPSKIDISSIKEKNFADTDKIQLNNILGENFEKIRETLDIESTFGIDLEEGTFFVLKDFQDGNYLSVKTTGEVYIMIHDPYKVMKIFDSPDLLLDAIRSGAFGIEAFYNNQFIA